MYDILRRGSAPSYKYCVYFFCFVTDSGFLQLVFVSLSSSSSSSSSAYLIKQGKGKYEFNRYTFICIYKFIKKLTDVFLNKIKFLIN